MTDSARRRQADPLRCSSSGETSPKPWRRRGRRGPTCFGAKWAA